MSHRLVMLLAVVVAALPPGARAQELAFDPRAPRFVAAGATGAAAHDVSWAYVLRRRITLELTDATLGEALAAIARAGKLDLLYSRQVVPTAKRVSLNARSLTVTSAITEILLDTGIDVSVSRSGQLTLVRRGDRTVWQGGGTVMGRVTDAKSGLGIASVDVSLEGTRWRTTTGEDGRYRLADVTPGSYTVLIRRIGYTREMRAVTVQERQEALVDVALEPAATRLGDVVVTSQKREERLQEVPIPVTAVLADKLVRGNQLRLQEYYQSIPGLSFTPAHSIQTLTIRGITSDAAANPSVGIAVDDVPYGSSTILGGGLAVPDFDPNDLARVEVLRGPQGTLYGASGIGGLLKFVTADPSTDRVSGRLQVGSSSVQNGDGLGYQVRGSVNLPLSDKLAVRASGFSRRDPGYIDDPVIGIEGLNRTNAGGGRLSALWRPSDVVSLKLSALLQKISDRGLPTVHAALGDLQQSFLRGTGGYDRTAQAYSAVLTAQLGKVDLTSLSGYNVNGFRGSIDFTSALGGLTQAFFGVTGSPLTDDGTAKKFSQEVRLSTPIGERLDWRLGAVYTYEDAVWVQGLLAADVTSGAKVGIGLTTSFPTTYEEYAAFTDLTFHVTDRLDLQIGGRQSRVTQGLTRTDTGVFVPIFDAGASSPYVVDWDTKDDAFTYLVTPRFKVSSDLMVYARLASGYRIGGPNYAAGFPGVPLQFHPDKTQNYELGVKGTFLNRKLSVDASLYRIDWKDMQITLLTPTFQTYRANASRAKSEGVELSVESNPVTGLTIGGWVAWNDAVLTEPFPPAAGQGDVGDKLPLSSPFSGYLSADQEFPLTSRVTGFVGASASFVDDRASVIADQPVRLPSYTKTDARAGVRYDTWTVNFFINNIADTRGVLNTGTPSLSGSTPSYYYIQPRTAGLSLAREF